MDKRTPNQLQCKRVDHIKFNTSLTVQVVIHNAKCDLKISYNSKCFKHQNLKVTFQEWKQHLKSPAFVDVASQQLHIIFEKWGHSGLNIFHQPEMNGLKPDKSKKIQQVCIFGGPFWIYQLINSANSAKFHCQRDGFDLLISEQTLMEIFSLSRPT